MDKRNVKIVCDPRKSLQSIKFDSSKPLCISQFD